MIRGGILEVVRMVIDWSGGRVRECEGVLKFW